MKRILTAALFVAFAGSIAFAQQPSQPMPDSSQTPAASAPQDAPPPPAKKKHKQKSPAKEAKALGAQLGLTDDQVAKIEPILADREQKLAALEADTTTPPEAKKKQSHSIGKQADQQLSTILTPDQMAQMKAASKHGGKHGAPPAEGAPATPPPPTA